MKATKANVNKNRMNYYKRFLTRCKTGYRAPYLLKTAKIITDEPSLLTKIATLSYLDAKRELMALPGVGAKVADCVLLFSYRRYEAVPVDVWIRNIITKRYFPQISGEDQKRSHMKILLCFVGIILDSTLDMLSSLSM
jgi:3-methyladenine DNA glycosylase/8-oxoguanine DNA glycosylase